MTKIQKFLTSVAHSIVMLLISFSVSFAILLLASDIKAENHETIANGIVNFVSVVIIGMTVWVIVYAELSTWHDEENQ